MAETAAVQNRVTRVAVRHRKSADGLSAEQAGYLRNGVAAMKTLNDDRGFAYHAGIHGLPLPMFCQHGTPLFLPWHRAYLYFFELALRDRVPQAMLPWWDWTSPVSHRSGLPALYARARVDAKANPLYSSPIPPVARRPGGPTRTVRAPGPPPALPTRQRVNFILSLGDFLDFSSQLEDLHGGIHVWVAGTMGSIGWAAYDPIFWAHHCMIDRLWRLWQQRHPQTALDAGLLREALPPFRMTVADTLDVTALGYDYAVSTTHTVVV